MRRLLVIGLLSCSLVAAVPSDGNGGGWFGHLRSIVQHALRHLTSNGDSNGDYLTPPKP